MYRYILFAFIFAAMPLAYANAECSCTAKKTLPEVPKAQSMVNPATNPKLIP